MGLVGGWVDKAEAKGGRGGGGEFSSMAGRQRGIGLTASVASCSQRLGKRPTWAQLSNCHCTASASAHGRSITNPTQSIPSTPSLDAPICRQTVHHQHPSSAHDYIPYLHHIHTTLHTDMYLRPPSWPAARSNPAPPSQPPTAVLPSQDRLSLLVPQSRVPTAAVPCTIPWTRQPMHADVRPDRLPQTALVTITIDFSYRYHPSIHPSIHPHHAITSYPSVPLHTHDFAFMSH